MRHEAQMRESVLTSHTRTDLKYANRRGRPKIASGFETYPPRVASLDERRRLVPIPLR